MKCIYCRRRPATDEFSGVGCGCAETPADMRTDTTAPPARRCSDCGEFEGDCECSGQPECPLEFGFYGRTEEFGFGGRDGGDR